MKSLNLIFTGILLCAVTVVSAQSMEEAKALYNEGVTANANDDMETAVLKFEECIDMCQILYEEEESVEAEDLMLTLQQSVPKMYLQISQKKAQEKDYNGSLKSALKAKETAEEAGNDDIAEKAAVITTKIYYSYGLSNYKAKKFDEAISYLDKAIEQDENYFKAHYLKVVILKDKGDEAGLKAATKAAMNASDKSDDTRKKTIDYTANYFYNEGVKAKQATNYDDAINNLNSSLEFNVENTDCYYLLASIYNSKEDWTSAIEAAQKGLSYANESEKARFNYELGNAYFGSGDNASACDAYSKAAVGDYAESAKYQMEHVVKCE